MRVSFQFSVFSPVLYGIYQKARDLTSGGFEAMYSTALEKRKEQVPSPMTKHSREVTVRKL
jgi:hypothetical protein